MTSISSALSLVDPVGQATARPAPAIALGADSGFDAIFARVLDQPDRSSRSQAPEGESSRPDRTDGAARHDDAVARREPVRSKDRPDDVDASSSGVAAEQAEQAEQAEPADSHRDAHDVERSATDGAAVVAMAVAAASAPPVAQGATTTPSLVPGVVTDASTSGATVPGATGAVAASVPTTPPVASAPGQPAAGTATPNGEVAVEQSIAVPTEPLAEVIAALQAESTMSSIDQVAASAEGEPTPSTAAGPATVTAAGPAPTVDTGQLGTGADGNQASNSGTQPAPGEASVPGQAGQVVADAPAEPIATPVLQVSGATSSDDGSAPASTGDSRGSTSPVGSVTSTGTTTAERVEASTVRAPGPDGQRPVDGRLRDRFVGSGLGASMTLDLSDEGLGQLSMQAHQGGGALHVTLAAGESSTRELLLGQSATLRSELEASGTRLGSFDVTDQLPGDTSRGSRGEDTAGQGAAPRSERRSGGEGAAVRPGAPVTSQPLSTRTAGSTGIDLLI